MLDASVALMRPALVPLFLTSGLLLGSMAAAATDMSSMKMDGKLASDAELPMAHLPMDMSKMKAPAAFPSHSSSLQLEVMRIADALKLNSTKTYGELGGGSGLRG